MIAVSHNSIVKIRNSDDNIDPQIETATIINELGVLSYRRCEFSSALAYFEKAYDLRRELLGDHPDTAQSLNNIAAIHFQNENYTTCTMCILRALAIANKCLGKAHPTTLDYQRGLRDTKRMSKQLRNMPKYRPKISWRR